MKKRLLLTLSILAVTLSHAQRNYQFQNTPLPLPAGNGKVWQLQKDFSDDFNYSGKGNSNFTNVWVDRYNPDPRFTGPGATTWVTGNSNVVNGKLELRGTPAGNRVNCGVISSKKKIKYPVYMEARIKAANIENSSNFWLLDSGGFQEIDILEVYGGAKTDFFNKQMSTNFHVFKRNGPNGPIQSDNTYQTFFKVDPNKNLAQNARWRDGYHTFGCYWKSPNDITFYIDGKITSNGEHYVAGRLKSGLNGSYQQALLQNPNTSVTSFPINNALAENQMTSEKFIVLDTESHEGRPISPASDLNNRSKNVMLVDWVRVYKPVNSGGGSPPPSGGGNSATQFRYDVGTNTSVVWPEYTRLSNTTRAGSFGWANTNGIGSRDRGTARGRNNINRDINFSKETRFFTQNLSNGNWNVLITFGDTYPRRNMNVAAEGQNKLTNINTNRGQYLSRSFNINVNDGKLDLRFSVGNGGDVWSITRIWIRKVGTNGAKSAKSENEAIVDIDEPSSSNSLVIYPNPAKPNDAITISGAIVGKSITIYDSMGRIVKELIATSPNQEISLTRFPRGMYFVNADNLAISKFMLTE